jgi:beta-galactosidase GanA
MSDPRGAVLAKMMVLLASCIMLAVQVSSAFDGRKWNVSTGNLSVQFIQGSPVGAFPRQVPFLEPPPSHEALVRMREQGLSCYEDYVAWGAVEREPGKWDWSQHEAVCAAVTRAGLRYVVYNWVHFPPVWLRNSSDCTLMRCSEHGTATNYLSIFDPKTITYYNHFYRELAAHFGDRIDGVYACILGPYGEGNYPLMVPDWVDMGHCHEGYWCADPHALASYHDSLRSRYHEVAALNRSWGRRYRSFAEVGPPSAASEGRKIAPESFPSPELRREWLDFIE